MAVFGRCCMRSPSQPAVVVRPRPAAMCDPSLFGPWPNKVNNPPALAGTISPAAGRPCLAASRAPSPPTASSPAPSGRVRSPHRGENLRPSRPPPPRAAVARAIPRLRSRTAVRPPPASAGPPCSPSSRPHAHPARVIPRTRAQSGGRPSPAAAGQSFPPARRLSSPLSAPPAACLCAIPGLPADASAGRRVLHLVRTAARSPRLSVTPRAARRPPPRPPRPPPGGVRSPTRLRTPRPDSWPRPVTPVTKPCPTRHTSRARGRTRDTEESVGRRMAFRWASEDGIVVGAASGQDASRSRAHDPSFRRKQEGASDRVRINEDASGKRWVL